MESRLISLLTAQEFTGRVRSCNGVIVPIASVEQCGAHGALGIDVSVADCIAPKLAEKADMLVAPTVPYGDALEMADYPGTVHIPTDVLGQYYYAVASSFLQSGAKTVMFLASHSLNTRAADYAARRLYSEGRNVMVIDFWKACSQVSGGILSDKIYGTGHGAEQITSVSLAIEPELIRKDRAINEMPSEGFGRKVTHIYGGSNVCISYGNFHDYCTSGSWGDVSAASSEKGAWIIEKAVELICREISDASGA